MRLCAGQVESRRVCGGFRAEVGSCNVEGKGVNSSCVRVEFGVGRGEKST